MVGPSFVGKAGQLAVMAEFLLRGHNVATPEVDVGDDIFVVKDGVERLWRIQVKTAIGVRRGYGRFLAGAFMALTSIHSSTPPGTAADC